MIAVYPISFPRVEDHPTTVVITIYNYYNMYGFKDSLTASSLFINYALNKNKTLMFC